MPVPRKAVQSLSISATGFAYPIIDAVSIPSTSIEDSKISAFGDLSKTSVPTNLQEYGEISITLLDEGDKDPPVKGVVSEFTFSVGYSDGSETVITRNTMRRCYVKSCEPSSISVDGERKSTWACVIVPQGGDDPDTVGYGASSN